MSECGCRIPPFRHAEFDSHCIGVDASGGRCGRVTIEVCRHCRTPWLTYRVEDEAPAEPDRWFRGPASREIVDTVTPETAVTTLESLPWHFTGRGDRDSTCRKGRGRLDVDA